MSTQFTLIRITDSCVSEITKQIDGDLALPEVRKIVDADEHCQELIKAGWWLDEWSVRHYIVTRQPMDV